MEREREFRPQNGLLPLAPTGSNVLNKETLFGNTLLPKSEVEGGLCITKSFAVISLRSFLRNQVSLSLGLNLSPN